MRTNLLLDKLTGALNKLSVLFGALKRIGAKIRYWRVLLIFALALALRLIYVHFFMQHRICNFGDASLYLIAGHQLSELVVTSHGIADFFNHLMRPATVVAGSFQSFSATGLTDRILMDGPVYPTYLALMQLVLGIGAGKPAFDGYCLQIATFNAVVDALHCILIYYVGRLAFGRNIGLIAGLLFAVYPPAILTTQQCYSEPFAGVVLTAWTALGMLSLQRHLRVPYRFVVSAGFGVLTGILILARPPFLLLPAIVLGAMVLAAMRFKRAHTPHADSKQVPAMESAKADSGVQEKIPTADEQRPVTNISFSTSYAKTTGVAKPPSVITYDTADSNEQTEPESGTSGEFDATPDATPDQQPTEDSKEDSKEGAEAELASTAESEPIAKPESEAKPETTEEATPPTPKQPEKPKTPPAKPLISKTYQQLIACFLAGFLVIGGLWSAYTCAVTGKFQPVIKRAPAYNLFVGNQVALDGWKTNPIVEGIPDSVSDATASIAKSFFRHPIKFCSMELRKLSRLWLGGWNDFQFDLFGISRQHQAVWHGLMLWCGFVGAAVILFRRSSKREFIRAIMLVSIVAFHCIYCLFEPVSRYCMTAMPSIMILAAISICSLLKTRPLRPFRLALFVAAIILFFNQQASFASSLPSLMGVFPPAWLGFARFVDASIFALGWILVGAWTSVYCKNEFKSVRVGALVCAFFAYVHLLGDSEWREWFVELRTIRQVVTQEVFIPADSQEALNWKQVFVLVDIHSPNSVPPMAVMVNGVPVAEPLLTWFQVSCRKDILEGFAMQGSAMGKDPRSFRQWWAFPIPVEQLKFGDNNRIQLAITADDVPVGHRLFGDYERPRAGDAGEVQMLPSFNTVSFTKGFATFGTGESRIYENQRLGGRTMRASLAVGKDSNTSDLSLEHGRQVGAYRVRVAVPYKKAESQQEQQGQANISTAQAETLSAVTPLFDSNRMLLVARAEHRVSGSDPNTFFLGQKPVSVPSGLRTGTRIHLAAELMHPKTPSECSVTLRLQGIDKQGLKQEWTPLVTPTRITAIPQWRKHTLCDIIPDEVLGWSNLTASVVVSPFPSDKFWLHGRQALRDMVFARNVSLVLLDAIDVPPPQDCEWRFY